ncbi:MAG: hypothetical protein IIA19_08875, partial [Thaumarchaeota archaeon]|nr:hypothetical protein [Nitrososphaerota archaeon]
MENNKALILFLIFVISISSITGLAQIANAESSANIDQCANGPLEDPQKQNSCDISDSWVNGNLNQNNAHWREGESNVYRLHLTNLENNTLSAPGFHNIVIGYDITHSDKHGIDYLTSFNRTETLADPCIAKQQGQEAIICNVAYSDNHRIPNPKINTVDYDNDGTPDGSFQPITSFTNLVSKEGDQSVLIWAFVPTGESIEILAINYTEPFGDFSGSNSAQAISINFTTTSESAVFAWGGHIASRTDWGFDSSSKELEANSAADINGSPYHMRLLELDGSGGNQDLPLDALAVLPDFGDPPTVEIILPIDGTTFASDAIIQFNGTATDPEDGDISGDLDWTS